MTIEKIREAAMHRRVMIRCGVIYICPFKKKENMCKYFKDNKEEIVARLEFASLMILVGFAALVIVCGLCFVGNLVLQAPWKDVVMLILGLVMIVVLPSLWV